MKKISLLITVTFVAILSGFSSMAQNIYTFAGIATAGSYAGDGGYAAVADLWGPVGIVTDTFGNVYFCDNRNNVVRKINAAGIITTIAGSGTAGYTGDGGLATMANLRRPTNIALDRYRNIYIADNGNNVVRKIDTSGVISTIAGTGMGGYTGDGGPATDAELRAPNGIAVDTFGKVYIADTRNNVIRLIDGLGNISTIVGTGLAGFLGDGGSAGSAQLNRPIGLALKNNGTLYIADSRNHAIRMVVGGVISTFAGIGMVAGYAGDGGLATAANLHTPNDVKIDAFGNVFITDSSQNVRMVGTNDTIKTFAGSNMTGYYGDGGSATNARMTNPQGVAIDRWHNVYISTYGNNVIRRVGTAIHGISITSNTGDTICFGNVTYFRATPIADTNAHYQWRVNGVNMGTDTSYFAPTGLVTGNVISCQLLDSAGGIAIASSNTLLLDSLPRTSIMGPNNMCIGNFLNINHTGPNGGTWLLTNSTIATLTTPPPPAPTRITSIATGIDTVFYIASNMCGTDSARLVLTIGMNNIGKINGPNKVCTNSTVSYTDTSFGGRWRTNPPFMNTIDSLTGVFNAGFIAGPAYIIYGRPGCVSIDTIMLYNLGAIAGSTNLCLGDAFSYVDTPMGGMWSISPATLGTIDSISGNFVANTTTPGLATITYGISPVCNVTQDVVIQQLGSINPTNANICVGATTTFMDTTVGGMWSASPTTSGTIDAGTGVFTANTTAGMVIINYSLMPGVPGCSKMDTLNVNALPTVAPITGATKVDSFWSITLTNSTTGGVWSSSNSAIATVDATGVVTGISLGVVTITYTVTNSVGCSSYVTQIDTVISSAGVGNVSNNTTFQIFPNPANGVVNIIWQNQYLGTSAVIIADVNGKTMYSTNINMQSTSGKTQLDISSLRQGIYMITIQSDLGFYCGKLEVIK